MTLQISDPLALLPYQTGLVAPPLQQGAAQGQSNLDSTQQAIVLGEPVPIVFGRRINGNGGIFVSPGVTEGRFENNSTTNELTVRYQLVLSEGNIPPLQLRDVYQRACRVGTWAQAYNARAGDWSPGNFIVPVEGKIAWNAPFYTGTGGTYANLTTLSYLNTHADGDQTWDKQVHAFVREGMQVTRILDNVFGSSNNLIDLSLYLIRESSRFPETMIDLDGMEAAAKFTDANGLFYNGIFDESTNLEDWLQEIARSFLLRVSNRNGKKSFRPRLPTNADGTIFTGAVPWIFTFTEEHVLPNGFDIEYIELIGRKPICAQMLWRQQPEDDIGIIRSTEVRFIGEAIEGPFEQYDLSKFCTSENHAVKVGAYEVGRRKFIEHTLRLQVRPSSFNPTIALGDIIRVELRRESNEGQVTLHNYLYEVERINRNISGSVELDLTHFPVNAQGQSILGLYVLNAVGAGFELPTGRDDFQCDIPGRDEDETPLTLDPFVNPNLPPSSNFGFNLPDPFNPAPGTPFNPTPASPGGGFGGTGGPSNPPDPFEDAPTPVISGGTGPNGQPVPGDTLSLSEVCPGQLTEWYVCNLDGTGCVLVNKGTSPILFIPPEFTGKSLAGVGRCPDPGAPDGFGEGNASALTEPVAEGDVLIGGLGSYSVSWNKKTTGQSGSCTSSATTTCGELTTFVNCTNSEFTLNAIFFETVESLATRTISSVYAMRAFATPAILQFVCFPSLGTLVKIIKVQVQEVENGPWVDRTITGAAAEGTDGEGNITLLGQFWNSSPTTTTAININIVGPP
jgi:hypothetical protein